MNKKREERLEKLFNTTNDLRNEEVSDSMEYKYV